MKEIKKEKSCSLCGKEIIGHIVLSPNADERYRHMCAECAKKVMIEDSKGKKAECPLCHGEGRISFIQLLDWFEQINN